MVPQSVLLINKYYLFHVLWAIKEVLVLLTNRAPFV